MDSRTIRIAVVDEEPAISTLLEDIFDERGWNVVAVTDIERGTEILRQDRFDVVILDLWFGGANGGYPVLEALANDPLFSSTSVIVCSGESDDLKAMQGWLTENGITVVHKPFDIDDLYAAVDLGLARSDTGRHITRAGG